MVFALETSCNLWQTVAFYLHCVMGYTVVLISPLNTYHERPILNLDFSRTDPKDAFTLYEHFSAHSNALHQLGITYDKLRQDLAQNRSRLRAHIERIFPEFLQVFEPDTETALYLLKNYLFPDEFLGMDIDAESRAIEKISRRQLGRPSLLRLQTLAHNSIGIVKADQERLADRLTLNAWIAIIEALRLQIKLIHQQLVRRAFGC